MNVLFLRGGDLLDKIENKSTREIEHILVNESKGDEQPPDETNKIIKGKRVSIKFSVTEDEYGLLKECMSELGAESMEHLVVMMRKKVMVKKEVKMRKSKVSSKRGYITAKVRREVLERTLCGL